MSRASEMLDALPAPAFLFDSQVALHCIADLFRL